MSYDNIIPFPQTGTRPPVDINQVVENAISQTRKEFIEEHMMAVLPHILAILASVGFDPMDDKCVKENIFFVEALKSLMFKTHEVPHPMQAAADRSVNIIDLPDGMVGYEYAMDDLSFPTHPKNEDA